MKKAVLFGLMLALVVSILPLAALTPKAEAGGCRAVYVVRRGDTLALIARRYNTTVGVLMNANNIKNRNRIVVGKRLCIPGHWPPPPPRPWPPPPPCCYYPPPPGPIEPPMGCTVLPVRGFGQVWYSKPNVRAKIGCPTDVEQGFVAVDEPFYSGYVVEDVNGKVIYVLFNNGWWMTQPAQWTPGNAIDNPALIPPWGYYQPQYSIGKMWREVDNLSQKLGWARTPQRNMNATRQNYQNGLMLWTAMNGVYVLYNDGTWSR